MPFNAKVKGTGYLFEAINDAASTRAVDIIDQGISYCGFLYPGQFDAARAADGFISFKCTGARQQAILQADELEQVQIPLKIRMKRGRTIGKPKI
jgi:hypothetical protein